MVREKVMPEIQIKSMVFGLGISVISTVMLCAAAAGLISGMVVEEKWMKAAATVIVALSAFLGVGSAGRKAENQICISICYFAALCVLHGLLYGGPLNSWGYTLGSIGIGCALAHAVTKTNKTKRRKRRKKYNR